MVGEELVCTRPRRSVRFRETDGATRQAGWDDRWSDAGGRGGNSCREIQKMRIVLEFTPVMPQYASFEPCLAFDTSCLDRCNL